MNIMNAKAALRGERGPPPHFAGRKRELAMMRHRLDIALREHDPAMEGALLITGIPGIGKTHLDLLSQEEVVEAVCRGLANLGVDVSEHTAEVLADASMRFPQHVRGHVEAACVVDERCGGFDSPEALAAALEIGRQSRERYYDGCVNAMGGEAYALYPLVRHMDERAAERLPRSEVESIIGTDVAAAAIQHGVLAKGEHGLLSFGIPSFHSYMARKAEAYGKAAGRTARPPAG